MSAVKERVDKIISENKVAVFSKSYCPFCTRVKKILNDAGAKKYFVLEMEDLPECGAMQDYLASITGGRSVPRVFVGGKFVGGCDDTEAQAKNGQLQKKLKEAGAL
nr:glutaredoxin 2/3-like isoform 1 [Halisarca dujardinii]